MQQVVESQSTSIASLTAERDCLMMGHQDESTGQGVCNTVIFIFYCMSCICTVRFNCTPSVCICIAAVKLKE